MPGILRTATGGTIRAVAACAVLLAAGTALPAAAAAPGPTSLSPGSLSPGSLGPGSLGAAAAARGRSFGTAVSSARLSEAAYVAVLDREFTSVSPETELMWSSVEPAAATFTFTAADRIVEHAAAHGSAVHGTFLVWHPGLPSYLVSLPASGLREALTRHVTQTVGHFRGRIGSWDVAAEAFADNGSRRPTIFQNLLGSGWIEQAFRAAREADPQARLCYDDYGIEGVNAKSDAVYALVRDLRQRGVPIDCVGLESHFGAGVPVPATLQANLQRFAALGVDVRLSQLDVVGSGTAQAGEYVKAVTACLNVPRCTGITVWGVTDRYSWRSGGTPLLFDGSYTAKPAYWAVLSVLGGA